MWFDFFIHLIHLETKFLYMVDNSLCVFQYLIAAWSRDQRVVQVWENLYLSLEEGKGRLTPPWWRHRLKVKGQKGGPWIDMLGLEKQSKETVCGLGEICGNMRLWYRKLQYLAVVSILNYSTFTYSDVSSLRWVEDHYLFSHIFLGYKEII